MLPGLVIQAEPKRQYPDSQAVAHLVGYVGEVTENDLTANRFAGAGLGTMWGWETAQAMLQSAGFRNIRRHTLPHDPMNVWFVSHKV